MHLTTNWLDSLDAEFNAQELESAPENMVEQGRHQCPGGCRAPYWAKKKATNGNWFVGIWCETCRRFIDLECFPKYELRGKWANHAWVAEVVGPVETLPIADNYGPQYNYVCTMCGDTGPVEFHHWFPRAIYGWRVADRMPIATLCKPCHNRASEAQRDFCRRIMEKAVKLAHKQVEAFG